MNLLDNTSNFCFANDTDHYYIPHCGVVQHTTKLWVVFNASTRDALTAIAYIIVFLADHHSNHPLLICLLGGE